MYFAMDEIGLENTEKIKLIDNESMKWKFIYDVANEYGFEGIHFTPSLYKEFGLCLHNVPAYFKEFKLSIHFGGIYNMISNDDYEVFNKDLCAGFEIASKYGMHDLSIHPPYIYGISSDKRKISLSLFDNVVTKWTKKAKELNVTFSMETHVSGEFFLFKGLEEFIPFVDKHPDLGILIDISHNYFDNYAEDTIIQFLGARNVKALHISDALQKTDFKKGTHLAIGEGSIDFYKLLKHFGKYPGMFGALEIKADNNKLQGSLDKLKNILL